MLQVHALSLVELLVGVVITVSVVCVAARSQMEHVPVELRTSALALTTQALTSTMIFASGWAPVGNLMSPGSFVSYSIVGILSPILVAMTPIDRAWRKLLFSDRVSPWLVGGSIGIFLILYAIFSNLGYRPPGEPIWMA